MSKNPVKWRRGRNGALIKLNAFHISKLTASAPAMTRDDVADIVSSLYANVRGVIKYKQKLRPYICPFHILVSYIPADACVLDVGCGGGAFISLLARVGRIRSAVGFDADRHAIQVARSVAATLPNPDQIRFEHFDAHGAWPGGSFDAVCIIDVMHHVHPRKQVQLLTTAAAHVAEGGILLYKDMTRRPRWRAWANRLHDLLTAGEWIHYAKIEDVVEWAHPLGLDAGERGAINMLWYRHEWCIFHRSRGRRGG